MAQLGHLVEHISVALQGRPLLGPQFDTELSHLLFNGVIAIVSLLLVAVYPRNIWVYPLALLCMFHGLEHIYIFDGFMRTGLSNGPGLLGLGGAFGVIPLDRIDLHNVYNGMEMTLIALGLWGETDSLLAPDRVRAERSAPGPLRLIAMGASACVLTTFGWILGEWSAN